MNINSTNVRYEIFPQMKLYDEMPAGAEVPYSLLSGPISFKSECINTDEYGFRLTKYKDEYISVSDINKFDEVNLLIGGSTAFGVGCEDDSTTVASMLSKKTGEPWINLGLRGGVSIQEYIHLISFINKAKKINNVIFLSGVNDFYINELNDSLNKYDNRFSSVFSLWNCRDVIKAKIYSKLMSLDAKNILGKSFVQILSELRKKNKIALKITEHQKDEVLTNNVMRNFMLYSALKKELGFNVCYVLQPFAYWAEKDLSDDEKKVFDYLDYLQKDTAWGSQKDKMAKGAYNRFLEILENASDKYGVDFMNSNAFFNNKETLFVDSVHLNDAGNMVATDLIINKLAGDK